MLVNLFHGFCMALADSVPGVSGGTIAFILGFYDRFLNALHDLFSGTAAERKAALRYLVKLGLGWVVGMGLAATALAQVFESGIYVLSSGVPRASPSPPSPSSSARSGARSQAGGIIWFSR